MSDLLNNPQYFEPYYEDSGMSDVRFDVLFPAFREVISKESSNVRMSECPKQPLESVIRRVFCVDDRQ